MSNIISTLKRLLIASFIIVVLLIVVPFFIPLDKYKSEVESQLSGAFGRSVIISSLRLQILPNPALTAKGIGIFGAGKTSGEMFVNRLEIIPMFHELLNKELVIRRIHLQGVATNQAFLQTYLAELKAQKSDEQSYVSVDEISGSAITLRMHDNKLLGPYKFKAFLNSDHGISVMNIAREDDSIYMTITPNEQGYGISARARNWTFPLKTPFHFDSLVATGQLAHDRIHAQDVRAQAYGGTLHGPVTLSWKPQWNISGQLDVESIAMEPFLAVLRGKGVAGNFNANLSFDLKADKFKKLLSAPYLDGDFKITDGVVSKIKPSAPVLVFDEFTGHGMLKDRQFTAQNALMKAYGGTFSGDPTISWQQGWSVKAQLEAQSIAIKPFLDVLGGKGVSGNFNSSALVTLEAPSFKKLLAQPHIDGEFTVTNGVISVGKPARTVFSFDEFTGHGTLGQKQFVTQKAILKSYGGTFKGDPVISWAQGWTAGGDIDAESIDIEPLLAGFYEKKIISGTYTGQGKLSLTADRFVELARNPTLEGQFKFKDGVFYKADLEKASTNLTKTGTTGGQTPFKNFSGTALIKDGRMSLSKLEITSSALEASGNITIDDKKNLDGRMDVGLRKTASLISIPLVVDGTTETPHLRPTKAAVIGGAVGTSVLGPGVGTAIGIKVGKILNKIGTAIKGDKNTESPAKED